MQLLVNWCYNTLFCDIYSISFNTLSKLCASNIDQSYCGNKTPTVLSGKHLLKMTVFYLSRKKKIQASSKVRLTDRWLTSNDIVKKIKKLSKCLKDNKENILLKESSGLKRWENNFWYINLIVQEYKHTLDGDICRNFLFLKLPRTINFWIFN